MPDEETERRLADIEAQVAQALERSMRHGDEHFEEGSDPVVAHIAVRKNSGSEVGRRPRVNLIEGTGVTLTLTDDSDDDEVDVIIDSTGEGGSATHDVDSATHTDTAGVHKNVTFYDFTGAGEQFIESRPTS